MLTRANNHASDLVYIAALPPHSKK